MRWTNQLEMFVLFVSKNGEQLLQAFEIGKNDHMLKFKIILLTRTTVIHHKNQIPKYFISVSTIIKILIPIFSNSS